MTVTELLTLKPVCMDSMYLCVCVHANVCGGSAYGREQQSVLCKTRKKKLLYRLVCQGWGYV